MRRLASFCLDTARLSTLAWRRLCVIETFAEPKTTRKSRLRPGRRYLFSICWLLLAIAAISPIAIADESQLWFEPQVAAKPIVLAGSDARFQVLVSRKSEASLVEDATHSVAYRTEPEGIIEVSSTGFVKPLTSGTAKLIAEHQSGKIAERMVEVLNWANDPSVDFANQIVPIFTKYGCNGGGCHGKAAGQNGFKLSLLGFEPHDDYRHLVKESRGRRLSLASPEQSLLLTKATGQTPHGGGARIDPNSHEYRLIRRWIVQGMPKSEASNPQVVSLSLVLNDRRMQPESQQQLSVQARFSNGMVEDVTRTAQYESNDIEMAEADETGVIRVKSQAGEVAVMARYQGQVAAFRASVPLAGEVNDWPSTNNSIDEAVLNQLRSLNIPVSGVCDDSTFIRRVTLDLTGRLPSMDETRRFLASTETGKRNQLIEQLLASNDYADYFANKWMVILRNRRTSPGQQSGSFAFHQWLQNALTENKPYDQFVRDIVAASGAMAVHPPVAWYRNVTDTHGRTEDVAQLFLGQRLQCARCHHHPFEKWSQEDYYRFSAFFALVRTKEGSTADDPMVYSDFGLARASHPRTGQGLEPAGLNGPMIRTHEYEDPRESLVDWMTQADNPYFAKTLVNRYWKHFFGRGLVEPEDDLRSTNPASNPELLTTLAHHFTESKFDLKDLVRFITQSRTYQLSSEANGANVNDRKCFSRFYPRRLPAEVLSDAIDTVTQSATQFEIVPASTRAVSLPDTAFASYFLTVFGRPEASTACECERGSDSSLAQSLQLANSKEMHTKLASDTARAAKLASQTERSIAEQVEELYVIALARIPNEDEQKAAFQYLESQPDRRIAYEDLTWVLLNSKEFLFNH
jgi:Protein of unknown function (DUF1553)/Protein of unknown function (DUF1549)